MTSIEVLSPSNKKRRSLGWRKYLRKRQALLLGKANLVEIDLLRGGEQLPMLDPWINTTQPPAEQFVFERNPYYHRVDENGLQLPYIDKFVLNVSSSAIIPAAAGTAKSARGVASFERLWQPVAVFVPDSGSALIQPDERRQTREGAP